MLQTLASLSTVSDAIGGTPEDAARLTRFIAAASRTVYAIIQRPYLFRRTYRDVYDGAGRERQVLRNWPVLSVASLEVSGVEVPAAAAYGQAGFRLEPWDGFSPGNPQSLTLSGHAFHRGLANVSVTYDAGYAVLDESQTVPAGDFRLTALAHYGTWAVDDGVTCVDGTSLTRVTGSPGQGQYTSAAGVYTFNPADAGRQVLLSYSFVPPDIEQAVIELVSAMWDTDIGGNIKLMKAGDATIERFGPSVVSQDVLTLLQPYKSVLGV